MSRPPTMGSNKPANKDVRNNGEADCYANLGAAIVEQACIDYVNSPQGGFERVKSDIERFFKSDWFVLLSGGVIDGEKVLQTLEERRRVRIERERERKRIERERRKEREGVTDEEC